MKYWLGIEIGGTKQQIGIVGDDGSVIKKQSGKPALVRGAQDILDWMESEIPHLTDGYEISGAGIGFGGVLDSGKARRCARYRYRDGRTSRYATGFRKCCRFHVPSSTIPSAADMPN